MNKLTIIHPRLQHLGMTTADTDATLNWYRTVLGMTLVHRTSSATGDQKSGPNLMAAWVSNDEANHRLAFVQLPGLIADPDRAHHQGLQHFAFEYRTIEDLRTSPHFAKNPMGKYVGPDKVIVAREAGASPWELHERAWTGEFAPATPYDPRVLL